MKDRFRLYRRGKGIFYLHDGKTGKQESLRTRNPAEAKRLYAARNEAEELPAHRVTMARAYLTGNSRQLTTRTWNDVLEEMAFCYHGPTKNRFKFFTQSKPIESLKKIVLIETESSDFLNALRHPRAGTSTNKWLRIVHNRALDLGWLLTPVLARKCWPRFQSNRTLAIKPEQHQRLVDAETDSEFKLYLQMLWETGGAQTDVACLHRDNVDLVRRRITFRRRKLQNRAMGDSAVAIGEGLEKILSQLPVQGYLFPALSKQNDKVRASRFRKIADRQGFTDISLHSYRYAWARRAKSYGMPLREAMAHLGHGSKAIHEAYSEKAEIVTLPLEYYEKQWKEKIMQFQITKDQAVEIREATAA